MSEQENGPKSPEELPSIHDLTDRTVERFLSQETFDPTLPEHPQHGKIFEGYTVGLAAYDVVGDLINTGVDARALASKLLITVQAAPHKSIDWLGLDNVVGMKYLDLFLIIY